MALGIILSSMREFPASAILTFSLVTTVTIFLYYLRSRRQPGLPPGPLGLPFVGSLPFLSPDLHRSLADLAGTYGPILSLRLGSRLCVVLSSPSSVKEALKDNDIAFANHDPPAAAIVATGGNDMVWAPYGWLWRTLRKVSVRELLSPSSIKAVLPLRRQEVRRAVSALRARAGQAVQVRGLIYSTSLGVMTSTLWGGLAEGKREEFREVLDGMLDLFGATNLSDFFPLLAPLDLQGVGRRMRRLKEWYDRVFLSIVEERMRRRKSRGRWESRDFLDVMMEILEREDEAELTMEHVQALFLDLIVGGADTTSTTVEWTISELLQNPDTMKKVQEELDSVAGKERAIEESDIPKLHYLEAVVKEVLRIHPVVPLLVPYRPSSTCTIGGYTILENTKVFINVWAIQRDPSVWKDPLAFKPERFLNAGEEKYDYNGSNFSYLPFGSGRRVCVGISLAERMILSVLASLLHSFDWRLPEGMKIDLSERFGIVMKKADPLTAIPIGRLEKQELYELQ